jgi:hypothetical protein
MNSLDRHRRPGELRSSLAQRGLGTILVLFSVLLGIPGCAVAIRNEIRATHMPDDI